MDLASVEVEVRGGPVTGVRSASARPAERTGLVLRVRHPSGLVGHGEASPLPGYSRDTLEHARAALAGVNLGRLPELRPETTAEELFDALDRTGSALSVSARFAVETALLDVLAQLSGRPLWALLVREALPLPVALSAFAGGAEDPEVVQAAHAARLRGAPSVKVKITGPFVDARQLSHLEAVRRGVAGAALRLDANQSLTATHLASSLEAVAEFSPEFVEEPATPEILHAAPRLPVPFALDESLGDPGVLDHFLDHHGPSPRERGCVAFVLKPMALGGFARCLALAARANALGIECVVSHLFDGPIALGAACHLAVAIASRRFASGLEPHGGLAAWPAVPVPGLGPTRIEPSVAPGLGVALPREAPSP